MNFKEAQKVVEDALVPHYLKVDFGYSISIIIHPDDAQTFFDLYKKMEMLEDSGMTGDKCIVPIEDIRISTLPASEYKGRKMAHLMGVKYSEFLEKHDK